MADRVRRQVRLPVYIGCLNDPPITITINTYKLYLIKFSTNEQMTIQIAFEIILKRSILVINQVDVIVNICIMKHQNIRIVVIVTHLEFYILTKSQKLQEIR